MCEISQKWVLFLYGVLQNIWSSRFGVDSCVSVVLVIATLSSACNPTGSHFDSPPHLCFQQSVYR